MNRIANRNKSDFVLFLKDLYMIFSLMCVAFTVSYFVSLSMGLDTNLSWGV